MPGALASTEEFLCFLQLKLGIIVHPDGRKGRSKPVSKCIGFLVPEERGEWTLIELPGLIV